MSDKYVVLAQYEQPHEAEIARDMLANEGVESFITDSHTVGLMVLYSTALGGIKLQVREEDLARANVILSGKNISEQDLRMLEEEAKSGNINNNIETLSNDEYQKKSEVLTIKRNKKKSMVALVLLLIMVVIPVIMILVRLIMNWLKYGF